MKNPTDWTEADQRAEDLANDKEAAQKRFTDDARAIAAPLMVLMDYMAARGLSLDIGDHGTDPDDVIANLAELLGCEVSERHKRAMNEWRMSAVLLAHTPAGQA